MNHILSVSILVATILSGISTVAHYSPPAKGAAPKAANVPASSTSLRPPAFVLKKMLSKAALLRSFCKANGYNSSVCFMMDMSLPSGRERFFIYDLKTGTVADAGLVTHGSGSVIPGKPLSFSNTPGSNCTSLGKYKIGKSYYGKFGLAFKLHGLDGTNSKAFARAVVLHAHQCVPDNEIYPLEICPSLGCPTVSPVFLQILQTYIQRSAKPVLLYIYQ